MTVMKMLRFALIPVVLALVACSPNPSPKPTGGIPVPTSRPSGAAPSAGVETADLIIRLDIDNDERGLGQHAANYLTSGSAVRLKGEGLETNTLTEAGIAALRAEIAKYGDLLAEPKVFIPETKPGAALSGRKSVIYTFVLERRNGERYTVSAPGDTSPDASSWLPDPSIERLNILAKILMAPDVIVGATGLASSTWTPYDPATTVVVTRIFEAGETFSEMGLAPDVSVGGWPFLGAPDTFGEAFTSIDDVTSRCSFMPTADAQAALPSFSKVGGTLGLERLSAGKAWRSGTLLWKEKGPTAALSVAMVALLPGDERASCAEVIAR